MQNNCNACVWQQQEKVKEKKQSFAAFAAGNDAEGGCNEDNLACLDSRQEVRKMPQLVSNVKCNPHIHTHINMYIPSYCVKVSLKLHVECL